MDKHCPTVKISKRGRVNEGRPSSYKPEYCERVIELGKQGYSEAMIAQELDVALYTLANWERAHPEFLAATTRAKELAMAFFEQKGLENIGNKDFNTKLWEVQVRCRFPSVYREIQRTELTGKNGGPVQVSEIPDADLLAIIGRGN